VAAILELSNIGKSFFGNEVLREITFDIGQGEIVALAGENGAGKSTLFKIITGQLKPDYGVIKFQKETLDKLDSRIARELGIGIVPQELAPYPDLKVYENLFVGREIKTSSGFLDRPRMIEEAKTMLASFKVPIDPQLGMKSLSTALTQIVEILKATTWGAKLLLLDEPTSSIPEQEVGRLHAIIKALKKNGVSTIFTTHRMAEIEQLADRVLVMRDGILVTDSLVKKVTPKEIVNSMVGRELEDLFPKRTKPGEKVRLSVSDLVLKKNGPAISLEIREGEILGLGGLVGAGRTEIIEAIYGIRKVVSGGVLVDSKSLKLGYPRRTIDEGIGIVPEDRKGSGLVLQRSIEENAGLPRLRNFLMFGIVMNKLRRKSVTGIMTQLALKFRSISQEAGTLSGGNQQKIVIGRWLAGNTNVLLLDEPTRGVDVGARGEIYEIICGLAKSGMAVLLASSDTPELLGLSHRVVVIKDGGIAGQLSEAELGSDTAQEKIFRLASGQALQ
jgi:ribose transport system ATP-binding protein